MESEKPMKRVSKRRRKMLKNIIDIMRHLGQPWLRTKRAPGTKAYATMLRKRFAKEQVEVQVKQHPTGWWYVQ